MLKFLGKKFFNTINHGSSNKVAANKFPPMTKFLITKDYLKFLKLSKFPFSSKLFRPALTKSTNFYNYQRKNFAVPTYEEYIKNLEKNVEESQKLSAELMTHLKNINEDGMFKIIGELNKLGIPLNHLTEVKNFITKDIKKIPLTKPNSFVYFLQFLDKLGIENIEAEFSKILTEYNTMIEKGKFSLQELIMLVYAYSKYQITDSNIWNNFYKQIESNIHNLQLENITQLLMAFTMIQSLVNSKNQFLLEEEKFSKLYKEIFSEIQKKIENLTYLDTFRICISMTKRPVNVTDIPENIWKALQSNFMRDIGAFDLYQMSLILLLFCETPYLNFEIFKVVESEITKEYLENFEKLVKTEQIDPTAFMEDLSKICFGFALSRQGSQYFWNSAIKNFSKYKSNMSLLTLENLLFVSYRLIDYLPSEFKNESTSSDESVKNLMGLFNSIEEKIIIEKLIENNKVDPFNAMMPFSRFGNTNEKIWADLTKNVMSVLSKVKSINPFLLNDIIFAFSNYYMHLILARDREEYTNKNFNPSTFKDFYYLKNFKNFWNKIEELIVSLDESNLEVPHIANMIIDLSQIDLELDRAWTYLSEILKGKLEKMDTGNFVQILMGYSKRDYKDPNVWKVLQSYTITNVNEFSLDELRKIVMSFLKHKELSKDLWNLLQERFANPDILNKFTLEYFIDLQIPFAISGIHNVKIWQKFEELVFRNLKTFENDRDFFMNTLYSFSRSGRGSTHLMSKFANIIIKDINQYEIDDLGHISVCLKPSYIKNLKIDNLLNESFWHNFEKLVESKLSQGKPNSLNNLLIGMKENEYLNKNEKLIRKVEDKIAQLLKDLPKEN